MERLFQKTKKVKSEIKDENEKMGKKKNERGIIVQVF